TTLALGLATVAVRHPPTSSLLHRGWERSPLTPSQLHNLSPASDDPLQAISPKLKRFPLLLLIGVMDVDAKGHARLRGGAMVGNVAQHDRGNTKLGHAS